MKLFEIDGHSVDINRDWIAPGILMLVPGIRWIGVLMILNLLKKGKNRKKRSTGWNIFLGLMILGSLDEIFYGLSELLIPLTILAVAGIAAYAAFKKTDDAARDCLSYIGDSDAVSIDELSRAMGIPEKKIEFIFRRLRKQGKIPATSYIDKSRNVIVLSPEGREAWKAARQAAAEKYQDKASDKEEPFEESEYSRVLRRIRALNDEIADPVVSEKIYRIESTTAKIFEVVQQKPERVSEIQTFLEYYLPTTLKLLANYANLERTIDAGENVKKSKAAIESIMDKLVSGFDDQLDRLYKTDAIDISNDVKTLEKMMKMEGLGSH